MYYNSPSYYFSGYGVFFPEFSRGVAQLGQGASVPSTQQLYAQLSSEEEEWPNATQRLVFQTT